MLLILDAFSYVTHDRTAFTACNPSPIPSTLGLGPGSSGPTERSGDKIIATNQGGATVKCMLKIVLQFPTLRYQLHSLYSMSDRGDNSHFYRKEVSLFGGKNGHTLATGTLVNGLK